MDDYTGIENVPTGQFDSDINTSDCCHSASEAPVTDQQLEYRIATLCATIAASEYQFLHMLSEFDKRGAWAGEGTRSCAHWLNWRCGMNLGAAREKVRVAHALNNLPKISAAFSKGHLSYSKVRAMTRIATPELEDELMITAQYGSASHIEKLVRIYRRCETNEELVQERNACNRHHYARELSHYWNEDGNLVIKATLPAEQGALVLKALEAATDSLKEDEQFDPWQDVDNSIAESGVDITESGSAPKLNGAKATECGERKAARKVDALVLIARDWLGQSNPASKNADRYQVMVNVDADILANKIAPANSLAQATQSCCIDDMQSLPVDTARRISCDCSVLGVITQNQQPLSIGRKTRSIPPAIRRALVRRDHGCTFPGCSATKYVEGHHIHHWANGGETSLDNLTLLCSHHHQLVHEGNYTVAHNTSGQLVFHDPRGRVIDPKQAQPDDIEYRFYAERMKSFGINEWSLWSYCGDRMDYDQAVNGLIFKRDQAKKKRILEEAGSG